MQSRKKQNYLHCTDSPINQQPYQVKFKYRSKSHTNQDSIHDYQHTFAQHREDTKTVIETIYKPKHAVEMGQLSWKNTDLGITEGQIPKEFGARGVYASSTLFGMADWTK